MEDLPITYKQMFDIIHWDKPIESLKSIKSKLEIAASGINDCITERKAELIIKNGLGYKGNDELHRSYPDTTDSRERVKEVTIVTRVAKNNTYTRLYFSKELHIFIKGEPEKGEDGLYCRITGTNLSNL